MSKCIQPSFDDLRAAVLRACRPTNVRPILEGRKRVAEMPRHWVLANIVQTARECLNLSDYWEYGRLLEVLHEICATELLKELVVVGLESAHVDVRDIAEIWAERCA